MTKSSEGHRQFSRRQIRRFKELRELRLRPMRVWRHWFKQSGAASYWNNVKDIEAELGRKSLP